MQWRIILDGKRSAAENMAVDEALMQGLKSGISLPTIRFYDWDNPTISCGYHQDADEEIDFPQLEANGWDFVRRPTGGRVVLHKMEVTYCITAPVSVFGGTGVTESYGKISQALATGLSKLGVPVEFEKGFLSSGEQRIVGNPCFTSSSRYELKVTGRKIVGSAQLRRDGNLLQHGSIQLDYDQSQVAAIMKKLDSKQRLRLSKLLTKKTTFINDHTTKKYTFTEVSEILAQGFEETWVSDNFVYSSLLAEPEQALAENLRDGKYVSESWNLNRSF